MLPVQEKGLYSSVSETTEEMDAEVDALCEKIATSHDKATKELKKIFWEGTEHWDNLLSERAKISGELILSNFSKQSIAKIKGK